MTRRLFALLALCCSSALAQYPEQPEVLKRLDAAASIPVGNSPDAFRKVAREANLKFE